MVAETFSQSLHHFAERAPFRPFTVALNNGARVTIDRPDCLEIDADMAVFIDPLGVPVFLDAANVAGIEELRAA
jgi:hypothetical protein